MIVVILLLYVIGICAVMRMFLKSEGDLPNDNITWMSIFFWPIYGMLISLDIKEID